MTGTYLSAQPVNWPQSELKRWLTAVLIVLATQPLSADDPREINFNRDVRPILSDKCYVCHGPDSEQRQADLRLDLEDAAKDSVIVPGKPDESEFIRRILTGNADDHMPPADSNLNLSTAEITTLEAWVQQGATWDQHWSFVAPRKVTIPEAHGSQWSHNEIDTFVIRNLEQNRSTPSEKASKETLLRRIFFDLTGLPPSLKDIDAFLENDSPEAWPDLIDRLLESHHFGERMASVWLDLARYSDTFGYQVDRDRHVWPWRDWVIQSFNDNMPHDDFITKQIAGDLLLNATDDDILATTFNRLHPQKVEGGSTPEEFRIEYVSDRTQTFATAFLGLTMECCRCHDHKYDPISQKEYYQLTSFFDNIDEAGLYSYSTQSTPTPTLQILDDASKAQLHSLNDQIIQAERTLSEIPANAADGFEQWLTTDRPALLTGKTPILPNRILHLDFEAAPNGGNKQVEGKVGKAIKFSGDDAAGTDVGQFNRSQPFTIALWMQTPDHKERSVVWHCTMGWTDAASRGYQLLIKDGRLHASLIHFWPGNAISIATTEPLAIQKWQHVTVRYDGSSRATGLSIFINGKPAATEIVRDNLSKEITGGNQHLVLGERSRDRGFTDGMVDELMVFDRQLAPIEVVHITDGSTLAETLNTPAEQLSTERRQQLFSYYVTTSHPDHQKQLAALTKLRDERSSAMEKVKEIMVMRERPQTRQTYLLHRGAYNARRDAVTAATPSILPMPESGSPTNRLGLAQWLTSPGHPLTARVAVNHYWQIMFGQGLVRTPEDFGSQGSPPTHPELLDWLAVDFMQHGWNVKRLLKQIAQSATYQQSSTVSNDLITRDPENRWLGRSPTHRLSAEMLRDNALAVSGLLVDRLKGPPAKPYEVGVSFKPTTPDKGDGLYRRSIYTYWKRTAPAPVMMVLDAVKRDVCRVNRERTASPLEAFVLMNGPQFVEASRALAEHLLTHHKTPQIALSDLFRTLTSREATENEYKVIAELLQEQLDYFAQDPKRSQAYLQIGSHPANTELDTTAFAALTAVTNALFSYDESLTKR